MKLMMMRLLSERPLAHLALALLLALLIMNGKPALGATAGNTTPGYTVYPGGIAPRRVAALTLNAGENYLTSAVIDPTAGYAYFGANTAPAKVIKVRLSDFTQVGTLTLNEGEDYLWSAAIDTAGGYAYFGTFFKVGQTGVLPAGKVIKIRLSDFTRVGALTLNSNETGLWSAVIDPAGGFAYFGTYAMPGIVVKVRLSDFTRAGALTLNSTEGPLGSAVIDPAGGYAYFGAVAGLGTVIKIRLSNFTRVGALTLNYGEDTLRCAAIDPAGGYAYFGGPKSGGTGQVTKVRLSDFTRVGGLELETPGSLVIDPAGTNILAGSRIGALVKVSLSDMSRMGAVGWSPGDISGGYECAVLDPVTGYAYFGGNGNPGFVRKMALACKGSLRASRMTLGEYGKVNDVRFYSHAAKGNLRLAIYDDATTKTLLWQSASAPNTAASAWLTVPISAGSPAALKLPPGKYWLAWQSDSTADVPSYYPGTAVEGFSLEWPYGSFPTRLGSAAITPNGEKWSQYLTYDVYRNAATRWGMYP